MSLKLCHTCNGRGYPIRGRGISSLSAPGYLGPCVTCNGSGFSNATPEQALVVEIFEAKGYSHDVRVQYLEAVNA